MDACRPRSSKTSENVERSHSEALLVGNAVISLEARGGTYRGRSGSEADEYLKAWGPLGDIFLLLSDRLWRGRNVRPFLGLRGQDLIGSLMPPAYPRFDPRDLDRFLS